ncbi:MAG TPA: hypothetical protein VMM60_04605, partial [Ilumatobacter sp.]|nr:hypothetical protein [Ilumatobacter sp.]
ELTEVDHDARRTSLQDALADLPGVVSVEIDGQVAQVDGLAAEGLGNDDGVVDTDATDRVISPAR